MQVSTGYPPNFPEIAGQFPWARRPGVIFTYGEQIFVGEGANVTPALKAHESVHSERQGKTEESIAEWWRRYLSDPQFRLEEELLAHRAEYRAFRGWTKDRNQVAQMLHTCAARLSSPLYGSLLSYQQARRFISVDVR